MLPITGRRGDLLVLRDDGWAQAPECHVGSGRTEGQGMEGRRTPRRLPWSLPRTPLPVPTRQLLQDHAALPVQSLRWVWKLQGPPLTKDWLCGRPPGEVTAGGGAGRNPLPPRLWAVTAPSQAPEGAPEREPRERARVQLQLLLFGPSQPVRACNSATSPPGSASRVKDKGCSALQRWGSGAWGVDGGGGSLSSPTSQPLESSTQPEGISWAAGGHCSFGGSQLLTK